MLSDIRDSEVIENKADLIAFIYRDEYYNPETEDRGITEIIVTKQSNGPVGTVNYYLNLNIQDLGILQFRLKYYQ